MPELPANINRPLSDTQSNSDFAATTVPNTVMAEQVTENVVNNSESTSGSPLVDAAVNQPSIASAEHGTHDQPFLETKTESLQPSEDTNQQATDANATTSATIADTPAEPSAGEATEGDSAINSTDNTEVAISNSELVYGVSEASHLADGAVDDGSMPEGSLDVSLNSDTEGSRGDVSDLKKDKKHHTRTNSVKKPTTFSKVSVTKNFLAKSATATPAVAKPSDKPSPVGTPPQPSAAKPRLIAKTGTSLRDIQKARLGSEGASGPDASKVWNKNRPVPPPPPRQFTDEELKVQYGIHLATRLQTDENGKESKWADIDDDEDDWAPETVVWMDGTKSTLAPTEAAPMEQKPASPQPAKAPEAPKPTTAVKKTTDLGPTKTILKPGAGAAAVQAKQNGSGAGTPTDRPSLKAKSPAPAPTKSPWAVLPPVDKISPVNPPVQQAQQLPLAPQDARVHDAPQPAREIAADTFDRSWREGEGGTRELFNSTNGRYEPVTEARRGSMKPDSLQRKPAVLQRPSQTGTAPAEPSAAFQTRSTSQTDSTWGRRRGSSVSQGSIPPARRMSVTKPADMSPAPERRTSTVIGHDLRTSPRMARNETAQPVFAQQSAWQQQMPPRPEPGDAEEEDPIKAQERIMREKRELAKKRRQEEEERLEAEKQERLKARLAQLEGAGKSRKEREAEAAAAATTAQTPSAVQSPETTLSAPKIEDPPAQATAETAAMVAPALESQILPPAPEPAQNLLEERETSPVPSNLKPQLAGLPERPAPSTEQQQRQQPRPQLSPRANARAPFQQQTGAYQPPTSYSSPSDRKQQPFGRSPLQKNEGFSPWGSAAPSGNVWGTSGIGNGTFEHARGFAPMPTSQQNSMLPPPPGMTRPSTSTRISPQSMDTESTPPLPKSLMESQHGFAPPGLEARPDPFAPQGRPNGTSPAPGLGRQAYLPGPIAPPSRSQPPQPAQQRQDPLSAWNSAAKTLPYQYKAEADAAEQRSKEPVVTAPREDRIKETFKQTTVGQGRLGGPRRYEKTEYTIHDAQGSRSVQSLSPAPPNAQTQPSGPFSTASPVQHDTWQPAGENTVRIPDGSMNPAHGGLPQQLPPIGPPNQQQPPLSQTAAYQAPVNFGAGPLAPLPESKEQSPPPPETSSHPVNSGDARHPLVRLPIKPTVKLPPAAPAQQPPPTAVQMPIRPISNWGPPQSSKPIVMQEAWQARFNNLFNQTQIHTEVPPSPPKTPPKMQGPVLAVASSSRVAMDEVSGVTGATVSLPQKAKKPTSPEGFAIDESDDVVSKPTIEQMFNEELSFGSSPKITVPRNPAYGTQVHQPARWNMLSMAPQPKGISTVESQSHDGFDLTEVHPRRGGGYFVHMPGSKVNKLVRPHSHHFNGSHGAKRVSQALHQEKRPPPKLAGKAKGKETSVPTSPAATSTPNGTSNSGSRKTSFQKTGTPGPAASSSTQATPATGTTATTSGETTKKSAWPRPPKGPPRTNRQAPPPVKSSAA